MKPIYKLNCIMLSLAAVFIITSFPLKAIGDSSIKLGYVNLQKALMASQMGKRAAETLKKERDAVLKDIQQKEAELKKMQEQAAKQVSVLTEESLKAKQEEFRKKMKEYKRFRTDAVQDWERKKREMEEKILADLVSVVQELGKEKNFTIIFAREQGIIYASDAIDLTDEVIKAYDAKQK